MVRVVVELVTSSNLFGYTDDALVMTMREMMKSFHGKEKYSTTTTSCYGAQY